jgi:transposase
MKTSKGKVTYVAMDVHPNKIVAMWGQAQETPRTMTVSDADEGLAALRKEVGPGEVWATYEASSCGFVLCDRLSAWGWKVAVLAPTRIPRSVRGKKRKTDLEDVRPQWEMLMAHGEVGTSLPKVWVPPVQTREDRELVRERLWVGEEQGRIKTKIRSMLRMHGVVCPIAAGSLWTKKHIAWLRSLWKGGEARSLRVVLDVHLRMLEELKDAIKTLDAEIKQLSARPQYKAQVDAATKEKGVGRLTAMTYVTEMGDVTRFKNRKQVGSYLGLTPTSFESGAATDRKGHISRMGPARVRKVLNQAAWSYLRTHKEKHAWYQRLAKRRGKKKAVVALMRQLGIIIWHRMRKAVA